MSSKKHFPFFDQGKHYKASCGVLILKEAESASPDKLRMNFAHAGKDMCSTCEHRLIQHGYSMTALKIRFPKPYEPLEIKHLKGAQDD